MLLDEQATRDNIIKAFQELAKNDNIKKDDSIFIFYAGHGAKALPPKRLSHMSGLPEQIEIIIPYDYRPDTEKHEYMPIPDFTLAVLVDKISKEKGDHIVCRIPPFVCICGTDIKCRHLLSIVATLHQSYEDHLR